MRVSVEIVSVVVEVGRSVALSVPEYVGDGGDGVADGDGDGVPLLVKVRVGARDAVKLDRVTVRRDGVPEALGDRVGEPDTVAVGRGVAVADGDALRDGAVGDRVRDVGVGEADGDGFGLRESVRLGESDGVRVCEGDRDRLLERLPVPVAGGLKLSVGVGVQEGER